MASWVLRRFGIMAGLISMASVSAVSGGAESSAVSFKEDIKPILEHRCQECHAAGGAGTAATGLLLDSYQGLMKGTTNGPVVVPGKAMTSNLLVLVEGKAAIRMPHNKKPLTKCEIDLLRQWVAQGAKDN